MSGEKDTSQKNAALTRFKNEFRDRISERRDGAILADLCEVTQNTVHRWGRLDYSGLPTIWQALLIAEARNVSPAWLAFGQGPREREKFAEACHVSTRLSEPEISAALAAFEAADATGRALLMAMAQRMRALPPGTSIQTPRAAEASLLPARDVAKRLAEDPAPYAKPAPPPAIDRRDEIPIYTAFRQPQPGTIPIPRWESVAAGFGEDLERSEELTYIRELPDWRNVHSVLVRGHSMSPTLRAGDLLLVRTLGVNGILLPPLEPGAEKNSRKILQREIPDNDIFILSIDGAPPTLKRVQYSGDKNWHLMIIPDNQTDFRVATVSRSQHVIFYARVLGIGDGKYTAHD